MADITLTGVQQNIYITKGDSKEFEFKIADVDNTPLDMTGYDVNIQVRTAITASGTVINATLANDKIEWVNQSGGTFKWIIAPVDTSTVRYTADEPDQVDGVYDVQITSPTSFPGTQTVFYGTFGIKRDVTRTI